MDNKYMNKYTGGFKKRGFRTSLPAVMILLLFFATLSAFNFKAPYTNVNAWIDGNIVHYRVYDSSRAQWMEDYKVSSSPANLISQDGVVAWTAGNCVYYSVYDAVIGSWRNDTRCSSPGYISSLTNSNGVVAWIADNCIQYSVYDPMIGSWRIGISCTSPNNPTNLTNSDGVVAWIADNCVYYSVYDAVIGSWRNDVRCSSPGYISNLTNSDGVAAWIADNCVYFVVYDHIWGYWIEDLYCFSGAYPSYVYLTWGTVTFYGDGQTYTRGYDHDYRDWNNDPTAPLANFVVSPVWEGNGGAHWVHFNDMSLGAYSYSWNFGDGGTSSEQCPLHVYTQPGVYTVNQYVFGQGGFNSTYQTVITDFAAPIGSIIIDNGNTETYSTSVTLTLSAIDDSGSVASMRFSNDGSAWSSWEQYATTKSWTLSSGYGTKTVYVQFRDAAQNTSSSYNDTIELLEIPTITVKTPNGGESLDVGSSYNILWTSSGSVGNVRIDYSIDNGTSWTAIITYTSNLGSYLWTVPNNLSSNCRVRVMEMDGNPSDMSDGVFSIVPAPTPSITVTAPNGGENWHVGFSQNITWTSTWNVGNVQIDYSADSGVSWTNITTSTSNDGSYTWTIPAGLSDNCRVRVMELDGNPSDMSDLDFSISTFEFAFYGSGAGTTGLHNSFFGVEAGQLIGTGDYNTFMGHQAGYSSTTGNNNVFLGYNAGLNELGSNKLFIANSDTNDPLIYGEFDNDIAAVNGRFGVGTTSPDYTMEVETDGENAVVLAHRIDGGDEKCFFSAVLSYGNVGTASNHPLRLFTNSTWKIRLETNGNIEMADGGSYNGTWNPACSRELKENIVELSIEEAIEAVESLEPVKYNYKNNKEEARVGFIAEDVPELVATNSRKNLSTLDIVAVLTKVVQEIQKRDLNHQKTISKLNKMDQDQHNTISELHKRISALEKK